MSQRIMIAVSETTTCSVFLLVREDFCDAHERLPITTRPLNAQLNFRLEA
jgi:hypothetical protein